MRREMAFICMIVSVLLGCGTKTSQVIPPAPIQNEVPRTIVEPKAVQNNSSEVDPDVFKSLRRSAKRIEGTLNASPTVSQLKGLVQSMSTELTFAADESKTPEAKAIVAKYGESLDAYKDSILIWNAAIKVKSQVPKLEAELDRLVVTTATKEVDLTQPAYKILFDRQDELNRDLLWLKANGAYIPLDLAYVRTDIKPVIQKNGLMIMDLNKNGQGWVSGDAAVATLWKKAAEKTAEAGALTERQVAK